MRTIEIRYDDELVCLASYGDPRALGALDMLAAAMIRATDAGGTSRLVPWVAALQWCVVLELPDNAPDVVPLPTGAVLSMREARP